MAANEPFFSPAEMLGFGAADTPERVKPGIDVLAAQNFAPLAGKNVGVITNHTGRSAAGRSVVDILRAGPRRQAAGHFQPGARAERHLG